MKSPVAIPPHLLQSSSQASGVSSEATLKAPQISAEALEKVLRNWGANVTPEKERYLLAELADIIRQDLRGFLRWTMEIQCPPAWLDLRKNNILAAMVEEVASQQKLPVPEWTTQVPPLVDPEFAPVRHEKLRLYLLTHAPLAYRRRNLFMESLIFSRI